MFQKSNKTSMEGKLANHKIKLAILILAHKNLEQLKRLIARLLHENVNIFIHIDKKWKLSDDEYNHLINLNKEKIFITNNRISASIYLWSLVEATMELVNKAKQIEKEKDVKYHYFALLSGQDYPIKPIDYLVSLLQNSYPKPFIDCTPYHPKNWMQGKFKTLPMENKVLLYFINKWKPGKIRRLRNMLIKVPVYSFYKVLKLFIETPFTKLLRENCGLYGGSAWWILPDKAISIIHQRYSDPGDKVVEYLSKTLSPEETFFQIMVMQTEVASLVELNPPLDKKQNCLTYAHFRSQGKPYIGHPYILDSSDFYMLKNLPHCFARKFDEKLNNTILDKIEKEILKAP
jgi:hypothetical protein